MRFNIDSLQDLMNNWKLSSLTDFMNDNWFAMLNGIGSTADNG